MTNPTPRPPKTWNIGPHEMTFNDEVMVLNLPGPASGAQFKQVVDVMREYGEAQPFYFIANMSDFKNEFSKDLANESSKVKMTWLKQSIMVGTAFTVKLAMKAVIVGMSLVGQADVTSFEPTLAAAQERIAKHRQGKL